LTLKLKNRAVLVGLSCLALLAGSASIAQAQSGGTGVPGSTESPPPEPPPSGGTSWTTYKAATWYGPGFWGKPTACGMVLAPTVIGAAHKKLPCGTQVTFTYNGASISGTVIDRGPYQKGYAWDLTKKTAKRIGFLSVGSGPIQATVTPAY
jgi:rare lipoprotein A (RlpA)-like double-psi beta-barrel protein